MVAFAEIDAPDEIDAGSMSGEHGTTIMTLEGEQRAGSPFFGRGEMGSAEQGRGSFTGYITDNETGLLHARARQYSPTLGRFVGREPLLYIDGYSLYQFYAAINKLDPSGLYAVQASTPEEVYDALSAFGGAGEDFGGRATPTFEWRAVGNGDLSCSACVGTWDYGCPSECPNCCYKCTYKQKIEISVTVEIELPEWTPPDVNVLARGNADQKRLARRLAAFIPVYIQFLANLTAHENRHKEIAEEDARMFSGTVIGSATKCSRDAAAEAARLNWDDEAEARFDRAVRYDDGRQNAYDQTTGHGPKLQRRGEGDSFVYWTTP